ncbi:hypothetical protein NQL31_007180 [Lotmaria passim]
MSDITVEELQRQIEAEKTAHKTAMDALAEQTRRFQSILDENQRAFTDLITRVTNLRVAKGEFLAAQSAGDTQQVSFHTGSDVLDGLLYSLQAKLARPNPSVESSVLQELETAALEAMTPYGARRVSTLFTSNAAAVRHTGVLLLFPNDVRGVRVWANKHFSSCASCARRAAQLPPWSPYRVDNRASGFAAAPNLRALPNKRYHHLTFSLLQERSLADRADTEQQLDLLRGTFFLAVQSTETSQPLSDAATSCATMTAALQSFLTESMTELREAVRTAAPWNTGASANAEVSAAMEILLHTIEPRVEVQAVPQPAATRHGAPCSLVQVNAAVAVPLLVPTVAPLLRVLQTPAQRRYMIETVLTPLAQRIGAALGVGEVVSHYTAVGLNFAEALYQLAVHQGLVVSSEKGGSSTTAAAATPTRTTSSSPSVSAATLSQLYFVLQALAVFKTTVEAEVATPHLPADATASSLHAKRAALQLLQSVLQHFTPPSPLIVPPVVDPALSELTIKIARAPTSFLEILNRTFSSNQRIPATSRSSALDTFISPKSKVSLGLKLFRELVVDVYRPYHPCTGVLLSTENGLNGRPRAPACVPVIDLPVDFVAANAKVASYVMARVEELRQCDAALAANTANTTTASATSTTASDVSSVERMVEEALQHVTEKLGSAKPVDRLRAQWAELRTRLVETPKACVDVLVPFSMSEVDLCNATKPLLYLRVVYEC